jgi:hypothetical protein
MEWHNSKNETTSNSINEDTESEDEDEETPQYPHLPLALKTREASQHLRKDASKLRRF